MRNYRNITDQIVFLSDLNYILAEARINKFDVMLESGTLLNGFYQFFTKCVLSLTFKTSYDLLYKFITANHNKIIKLIVIDNLGVEIKREIIVYLPEGISKELFTNKVCDVEY